MKGEGKKAREGEEWKVYKERRKGKRVRKGEDWKTRNMEKGGWEGQKEGKKGGR